MTFYHSIASVYDSIFPLNTDQVNFVQDHLVHPPGKKRLLDLGCATGHLAAALANADREVTGLDLDVAFIEQAEKLSKPHLHYVMGNMLNLSTHFPPRYFDAISCFGNTLVHLNGPQEISCFLGNMASVMKTGAKFLLQIIHYDRILDHEISGLSTIDNTTIRFERTYVLDPAAERIRFKTMLIIKETGQKIENDIPLYPIRLIELKSLLNSNGFKVDQVYGDFKMNPLQPESVALVLSCHLV